MSFLCVTNTNLDLHFPLNFVLCILKNVVIIEIAKYFQHKSKHISKAEGPERQEYSVVSIFNVYILYKYSIVYIFIDFQYI